MKNAFVDPAGVLRWEGTSEEVTLYGVNYMAPFAFGYRQLVAGHLSVEDTIRLDVRQLHRMGLTALRVHVWDREISDAQGNLLDDEHVRLLDFMVAECKRNGIYVLFTPINWYSNGYPGPDEPAPGFSGRWNKSQMGSNAAAIQAQALYLGQFVSHVNPLTGLAYKDDPAVFGFELCNEPYQPPIEKLKNYVETLAKAIRDTGSKKPLFYCASQSGYREHNDLLASTSVEGVTFGAYPTGLVSGQSLTGNYLSWVDSYPLLSDPAFDHKAKIVYEYDLADVDAAYLHPAMARTFRSGGVQWATQFHYVPFLLARENTPYPTHNLNLLTTPSKALSFMIAAEVFRLLPRHTPNGEYDRGGRFGPFHVDAPSNLSEVATATEFLYSNDTLTRPPAPSQLVRVAGCGNSSVVRYEGTGAYFLDRLRLGVWRLEVLPDVVQLEDRYGRARLDRPTVDLICRSWPISVNLPDLGAGYSIFPLTELSTQMPPSPQPSPAWAGEGDGPSIPSPVTNHTGEGERSPASADTFAQPPSIPNPFLPGMGGRDSGTLTPNPLSRDEPHRRGGPEVCPGVYILSRKGVSVGVLPVSEPLFASLPSPTGRIVHRPVAEVIAGKPLTISVELASADLSQAVTLRYRFSSSEKWISRRMRRRRGYEFSTTIQAEQVRAGILEYRFTAEGRTFPGGDSPDVNRILRDRSRTVQVANGEPLEISLSTGKVDRAEALVLRARAITDRATTLHLSLVDVNEEGARVAIPLTREMRTYRLSWDDMRPAQGWVLLHKPDVSTIRKAVASLSATEPLSSEEPMGVEIESIGFGPRSISYRVPVRAVQAPSVVFDASRDGSRVLTHGAAFTGLVPFEAGEAYAMLVRKLGWPAHSSWRFMVPALPEAKHELLVLRAKSYGSKAAEFQVAVVDNEGRGWATLVTVGAEWQDVKVRLSDLKPTSVFRVPSAFPPGSFERIPAGRASNILSHVSNISSIQIGFTGEQSTLKFPVGVAIATIRLE